MNLQSEPLTASPLCAEPLRAWRPGERDLIELALRDESGAPLVAEGGGYLLKETT